MSFWTIFYPFTPYNLENYKFEKTNKQTKKRRRKILLFTYVYHKWQSYHVWFLRYGVQQKQNFWWFLAVFCPSILQTTPQKNENILKKWKKMPKDFITLHMCTINDNHMMYGFWNKKHGRHNFLSFWAIFLNTMKNQENVRWGLW